LSCVHNVKSPIKDAVGTLSLDEDGAETVVHMRMDYQLKYGPVGALADTFIVRSQLKKAIPAVLQGLKHFMETGEEITPEVMKNIRLATA
jgi:hypothetical protein